MNNALMDELRHLVGAANLLTEDLDQYVTDWRKRAKGKALCVVRPGNATEVAAVVKACAKACPSRWANSALWPNQPTPKVGATVRGWSCSSAKDGRAR